MAFRAIIVATLALSACAAPDKRRLDDLTELPTDENVLPRNDGTFQIKQVRNEAYKGRSGIEAMLHAYAKYNIALTPALKSAVVSNPNVTAKVKAAWQTVAKRGSAVGTTSAIAPQPWEYEFLSVIKIGTPPQSLNLDIDTGSSDLWTFSTDTASGDVDGQGIYKPHSSTTAIRKTGSTFSIRYGDGSGAQGIVYTDRVAIGNAVVSNMLVESAQTVSDGFSSDSASSGILGLAMSSGNQISPTQGQTFMDKIKSQLAQPLFTANLKKGASGNYNFGYIDTSEYTKTIQYSPLDKTSIYWKFTPTGYRIGAATAKYTSTTWAAIADTATTLFLLPSNIVNAYYATIPGAKYDSTQAAMVFPCATTAPDFTFGIGNYRGVVPGSYIRYGALGDGTWCYGGIQSQGNFPYSIFGDIVLKAQFVVFDLGNMRVGFANKPLSS